MSSENRQEDLTRTGVASLNPDSAQARADQLGLKLSSEVSPGVCKNLLLLAEHYELVASAKVAQ